MKNISLNIPDNKFPFFMELIQNLGFVEMTDADTTYKLTEEQLQLVEEERRKVAEDPGYALDWDEARKTLRLD